MPSANAEYNDPPPAEYFVDPRRARETNLRTLFRLIKGGADERELDALFRQDRHLFCIASNFFRSGHHGCWVIPQARIKPPSFDGDPGLIPDFLVAARNSDGITWWIVELKQPTESLYTTGRNGPRESAALQAARRQLEGYVSWCRENGSYLRTTLGLRSFREPIGVLIMGRAKELDDDPAKRECRRISNLANRCFQIRTWDAMLRDVLKLTTEGDFWAYIKTLDINMQIARDSEGYGRDQPDQPDQPDHSS